MGKISKELASTTSPLALDLERGAVEATTPKKRKPIAATTPDLGPPFGLSATQACKRGGFGLTYFWSRVAPTLECFREGKSTKFTLRSIIAREERLIEEERQRADKPVKRNPVRRKDAPLAETTG